MRLVTSIVSESWKAAGARRSELLSTSPTSALLREGRLPEPEKMTSSMPEARIFLNEFSPITQRRASTRFDLPQPFGPTMPVNPGSILNSALSQKLLKPVRRKRSNFIVVTLRSGSAHFAPLTWCCPRRIIFREAYAGLSGHRRVAQSTPTRRKLVRNRGIVQRRGGNLAASGRLAADPPRRTALRPRLPVAAHPILERAELLDPHPGPARACAPLRSRSRRRTRTRLHPRTGSRRCAGRSPNRPPSRTAPPRPCPRSQCSRCGGIRKSRYGRSPRRDCRRRGQR